MIRIYAAPGSLEKIELIPDEFMRSNRLFILSLDKGFLMDLETGLITAVDVVDAYRSIVDQLRPLPSNKEGE